MRNYKSLDDSELLSFVNDNDQYAFTEIYNRYHSLLYLHVFNKIRKREEAKDIIHNVFAKLWESRANNIKIVSLKSYLYAAVRFQVFDWIGKQNAQSLYIKSIERFFDDFSYETDSLIREKQLITSIEKEISRLPPKMKEIFELSRKSFLTHKEIGTKLNLSEKTVKKQINNSLKILRARLTSMIIILFL